VLQALVQPPSCAANELLQYERSPGAAFGRWFCTAPIRATSPDGWCRADGGAAAACDAAPPSQLATPPDCMAPRGLRLEYIPMSGWACICAAGYTGASCQEGSGDGSASAATPAAWCAALPPPCAPPGGTGTYSFDANASVFACVCAAGYSGAPCAA
jgi:hypothetical protein